MSEPTFVISAFSIPGAECGSFGLERVAANELGAACGLVGLGHLLGAHLVDDDRVAALGEEVGRFAAGEPAAHDMD